MVTARIEETREGATAFFDAFGLRVYRVIPVEGDPTPPVLTVEEMKAHLGDLVAEERLTAAKAKELIAEAKDLMPADFAAVIKVAKSVELPELSEGWTFMCATGCGMSPFRPHGSIRFVKGGELIVQRPLTYTLLSGFRDINSIGAQFPELMSGELGAALFQEMIQAGLDESTEAFNKRLEGFDEPKRAAYDAYVASTGTDVLRAFRAILKSRGVYVVLPGEGSILFSGLGERGN